ncbi:MAG: hypothetical protein GSR79_03095, partial [Desulfurococcales archaeon]|nr:hypothetical protein [Desulfurococcales archaeon]
MDKTSYMVTKYLSIRSAKEGKPGWGNCIFYISNITGIDKLWTACPQNKQYTHDLALPWEGRIGDYVISNTRLTAFTTDYNLGNEFWGLYID